MFLIENPRLIGAAKLSELLLVAFNFVDEGKSSRRKTHHTLVYSNVFVHVILWSLPSIFGAGKCYYQFTQSGLPGVGLGGALVT